MAILEAFLRSRKEVTLGPGHVSGVVNQAEGLGGTRAHCQTGPDPVVTAIFVPSPLSECLGLLSWFPCLSYVTDA